MTDKSMFYGASPLIFENAKLLRRNLTPAESILWQRLSKNQLNYFKFRKQHPVKNFIADFYWHSAKLVIEIDGEIHSTEFAKEYDEGRTEELKEFDIKVIRFSNQEIESDTERVIESIKSYLPPLNTPDP